MYYENIIVNKRLTLEGINSPIVNTVYVYIIDKTFSGRIYKEGWKCAICNKFIDTTSGQ